MLEQIIPFKFILWTGIPYLNFLIFISSNNEKYDLDHDIEMEKDMTVEEMNEKLEKMYGANAHLYEEIN